MSGGYIFSVEVINLVSSEEEGKLTSFKEGDSSEHGKHNIGGIDALPHLNIKIDTFRCLLYSLIYELVRWTAWLTSLCCGWQGRKTVLLLLY